MATTNGGRAELESTLFKFIAKNDFNGVKTILSQFNGKINFTDENGITPLQHAAYKGSLELTQLLLDQGADVHAGSHEHLYTALHFGALSGNTDVCLTLLAAGAKIQALNSTGRTAAQMAAFVGHHVCVALINNYVPKSEVDYFTEPHGTEATPRLPEHLSASVHKLVLEVNLHPVRLALNMQKMPGLMENLVTVKKVLDLMSLREMSKGSDTNEVLAFKFHYLASIVDEIHRCQKAQAAQQQQKRAEERKSLDPIDLLAKKMLKSRDIHQIVQEYQETFLREVVRDFHNRECTLFRQLIATLSRPDTNCLAVLTVALNGQRGFTNSTCFCFTCNEENPTKKCSKCKSVQYCDRVCQRLHWFMHKKCCVRSPLSTP